MDGFCRDEINPFGPVHEYVAPPTVDAVRLRVEPTQTAPPFPAVGGEGTGLTVTVVAVAEVALHPLAVVTWTV